MVVRVVLTPKQVGGQSHFRPVVVRGHPCIYVFHQVLNWLTPCQNKIGRQPELLHGCPSDILIILTLNIIDRTETQCSAWASHIIRCMQCSRDLCYNRLYKSNTAPLIYRYISRYMVDGSCPTAGWTEA